MGYCYLSRRIPYEPGFEEQQGVYPIGTNGMPEGNIYIPEGCQILSKYICSENPQVTGIHLPSTMTGFEDDCFLNCPNITKVCCVNGIEIIPNQCFLNCKLLEEVTLPRSLQSIGIAAFKDCPSLKRLIFISKERDNPVYHAYKEAFANCPSLTDEDVNNIAEYMDPNGEKIFANNPQLVEVEVYRLGDEMFDMSGVSGKVRSRLKKVTIKHPNSQGIISANLPFNDCYSLETVVLPEGTLAIGDEVLFTTDTSTEKSCIMHVNIPSTCKSIGSKTFYHSPNLQELFIPKSITYIGRQAFEKSNLSALEVETGTNCKIDSSAFKNSKINNESVNILCSQPIIFDKDKNNNLIITEQQFAQCNNLTDIATSRSYKSMFEKCEFLKSAEINDQGTNTTLYAKMFKDCISLTDVTIKDADIITFGESMFEGCSSLKNVSWPTSTTKPKEYGKRMFAASGLEEIRLQDKALNVSEEMFKDCRALKHIYLPNDIIEYGANCFNNCGDFKGSILEDGDTDERLIVSSQIKKIGNNAFEMCGQLEKIVFPKISMDSLGDYVFKDCIHLKEVQMPKKINTCGVGVFQGCISLQHINPVAVYNYRDSFFADLPNLEEIIIPNGVTKLDLNLFARCTNLKKVVLPASINSWGSLREDNNSGSTYYSNTDAVIKQVYYNKEYVSKNLYIFLNCPNLTDVVLETGWNQTFDLHSLNLTFDSIVQILINIADVSSYSSSTRPKLTLGENNLKKIPQNEDDIQGDEKRQAAYDAYITARDIKKWTIE